MLSDTNKLLLGIGWDEEIIVERVAEGFFNRRYREAKKKSREACESALQLLHIAKHVLPWHDSHWSVSGEYCRKRNAQDQYRADGGCVVD